MRYVLALVSVFALGAPVASALPTLGEKAVAASQTDQFVQVAKRKAAAPAKSSKKSGGSSSAGGIHPLVGSGDY